MGKTIVNSNYRVEVIPDIGYVDDIMQAEKRICKEMIDNIKRHVDNVLSVSVIHDTDCYCEYCGYNWIPGTIKINGKIIEYCNCCCDKEVAEWEKRNNMSLEEADRHLND